MSILNMTNPNETENARSIGLELPNSDDISKIISYKEFIEKLPLLNDYVSTKSRSLSIKDCIDLEKEAIVPKSNEMDRLMR